MAKTKQKDDDYREKNIVDFIDEIASDSTEDVAELITAKLELAKLDALELLSAFASKIIISILVLIAATSFFIALALYLGELFGQRSLGFLTVGAVLSSTVFFLIILKPDLLRDFFLKLLWQELKRKSDQNGTNHDGP